MIISRNNIGKSYNRNFEKAKINLDINTFNILCKYILQDPRLIRMEHLVQLRRLLNIIDPSTYENDPDKVSGTDDDHRGKDRSSCCSVRLSFYKIQRHL
jgi:hypothetical protein